MEELMQYVWQYRLWPPSAMSTVDGRRVTVIDPGMLNRDAGPDFFNAKVAIDGQLWSGCVEMHLRASDWARHGHQGDPAYDSVVLHVVEKDDAQVRRSNGETIPQMVMTCARDFAQKYHEMVNNPVRELPCGDEIASLPSLHLRDWITAMAHERIFEKSDRVAALLHRYSGNWADAIYVTLARALGFSTNAEPFELLAQSMPLKYLLRNSDSLLAIEAMLFGQSGLLEGLDPGDDNYLQQLQQEYAFYAAKYSLRRSPNLLWKMARMRPQNFPHRRIAALAAMVHRGFAISGELLSVASEADARALFSVLLTGYWSRHFNFSPSHTGEVKAFSYTSATVLIINVVVPLLYAYGQATGDERRQEAAIELLQSLKPEQNSLVDVFRRAGIAPESAFDTQGLLHLRRNYCLQRKCLFCRLGHKLLSQKAMRCC